MTSIIPFRVEAQFIAPNSPSKRDTGEVLFFTQTTTDKNTHIVGMEVKERTILEIDNLIVLAIVAVAVVWLIWKFTRKKKGCDSCDKCE
jgi:hypothetical protein